MSHIQPVILAGGTGTRLWPLSRELYPKQLLNLTEDVSLLQATIKRIISLPGMLPPLIVVGHEHRFLTQNQVEELGLKDMITIIIEPVGRDTAPAICAAAVYALAKQDENTVLLVLPADHLISKQEAFLQAVLLMPRSITSDFNFPKWHYYGRGSGEEGNHYDYALRKGGRRR